jgi:hypothetical protein
MPRSRTYYVRTKALLPPDNPLAPFMARLFVIWQDLLYEEAGIREDDGFERLDRRGPHNATRRLYFLRGNSRTLINARLLFDALGGQSEFRSLMAEHPRLERTYRASVRVFNRRRKMIERVRDEVGGHVGREVGESIRYLTDDDETTFELHENDLMRPHVATDILYAALAKEREPKKRLAAYRRAVKPLAEATGAMIKAMSAVMNAYDRKFRILPPHP